MNRYKIKLGETFTIVGAATVNKVPILLDETSSAACRVTRDAIGGTTVLDEAAMEIVDGQAKKEIDTGGSPWTAGIYFYDVRITNSDGIDFWSAPVRLNISARNTPASA